MTEKFISEIESRPALYAFNRDVKMKLWLEVASKILLRFEEITNEMENEEGTCLKKNTFNKSINIF